MNRFRTKKKAKDAADGAVKGLTEADGVSIPVLKSSKTFRLGKKHQEPPPRMELDLANALPSTDDFRTSLLMNGLSARFSMLREQDDPKSKIGKASDDSVLFPSKRQSRLHEYGFQPKGLSDIAEVASINGSIRPPFAIARKDSYNTLDGSGYGTDDDPSNTGSIMNRAKPGEGNNLFGGRQKIYKIPVNASGSTKSLGDGGRGMGGRALYENDVSQSAFQKLREREKEQQQQDREESDSHFSRSGSPPLTGYNRNRETSSTTSSAGPSNTRISTAATSFTSQRTPSLSGTHTPASSAANNVGVERSATKSRRLYETGLDQHLHEQQHSAMNRIDTLTRQRTLGAQSPSSGYSSPVGATHPGDRWDRPPIIGKASMPNLRATSPPPTATRLAAFDFGVRTNHVGDARSFGMTSPPLSPPTSDQEEVAILPVQSNEKAKATAFGTFQKPIQPYNEAKYSQRQLQMQQGRETPPLRNASPPRAFPSRHQPMGRMRADSNATYTSTRSSSNSSAQRHFLPPGRIPESPSTAAPTLPQSASAEALRPLNVTSRGLGLSDDESHHFKPRDNGKYPDLPGKYHFDQPQSFERPPESQHPANRPRALEGDGQTSSGPGSTSSLMPSYNFTAQQSEASSTEPTADSPTLGPTTGLSGMVRQHLRSESNASSIYGAAPSAGFASSFPRDLAQSQPQNDYSNNSNPWEAGDWAQTYYGGDDYGSENVSSSLNVEEPAQGSSSARSPAMQSHDGENAKSSWEIEIEARHSRQGSSATQKEREDFQNELANRRRRVQENLKTFVETESKSASPVLGADWSRETNPVLQKSNALGLLKSKTSRGSVVNRNKDAGPSKTMKMLGIGQATISSSTSPGKSTFEETPWNSENQEEEQLEDGEIDNKATRERSLPPPTKSFAQARRDARRDRERQVAMRHQQRLAGEANGNDRTNNSNYGQHTRPNRDNIPSNVDTRQRLPSRDRHPPPVAMNHRNRNGERDSKDSTGTDRSGSRPPSRSSKDGSSSDASGRSKSRNGRYRDDLAKAMAEGTSSSTQAAMLDELEVPTTRYPPRSPLTPGIVMSSSATSPLIGSSNRARSRSNSRTTPGGYFDSQNPPPPVLLTSESTEMGQSPRPSPFVPTFANTSASPIPSGANTPTANGFNSQPKPPTIRKRSINKSEISEPRFISSTSRVTTVDLPEGASLQNGSESYAPPIPPVNPKRRQPRAVLGALMGKKPENEEVHNLLTATKSTDAMSTFSADEGESKSKGMRKLRKSSSEGGNLNVKARQAAFGAPSPAVPDFPPQGESPPRVADGAMF